VGWKEKEGKEGKRENRPPLELVESGIKKRKIHRENGDGLPSL
jgi:hypothetical protein